MKKLMTLFAVIALAAVSTGVCAQSRMTETQKEEAKAKYAAYREKLNLSDDQAAKVEQINSTYFESLSQLRGSNDRKLAKYRKFKEIQSTKDSEMKKVLNADQFKQYKEFQAEVRENFKENRRNNK